VFECCAAVLGVSTCMPPSAPPREVVATCPPLPKVAGDGAPIIGAPLAARSDAREQPVWTFLACETDACRGAASDPGKLAMNVPIRLPPSLDRVIGLLRAGTVVEMGPAAGDSAHVSTNFWSVPRHGVLHSRRQERPTLLRSFTAVYSGLLSRSGAGAIHLTSMWTSLRPAESDTTLRLSRSIG